MSQQDLFAAPLVRYGLGASGALLIAFIAYSYLDGTTQLIAYAIAVLDFIVVPQVLKQAAA